jgi:hypothetical protein
MSQTSAQEFSARIEKVGINPFVSIPPEVSLFFTRRGYIPVKGTLNATPIKATLVPVGGGAHRLYINTAMRHAAKVGVGDTIHLRLEIDAEPRFLPVPEQFRRALQKNERAKAAFASMTPSHRNKHLAYLNSLKTPAAPERNIRKVIDSMTEQEIDRADRD